MRIADGRDRTIWLLWSPPVAVGIVTAAVFLGWPEIDLAAARLFYAPESGFVGQRLGWVEAVRQAFIVLYFGTVALCVAGVAMVRRDRAHWLRLDRTRWLFLAACLAAGP